MTRSRHAARLAANGHDLIEQSADFLNLELMQDEEHDTWIRKLLGGICCARACDLWGHLAWPRHAKGASSLDTTIRTGLSIESN